MEVTAQRGFIVIVPHPVEEGLSPRGLALVVREERVEDAITLAIRASPLALSPQPCYKPSMCFRTLDTRISRPAA